MIRGWSGAGFPLALLLTLAALTAWLRHAVELPEAGRDGKLRHDPDYRIENPRISRLGEDGRLLHTMHAERLVHFPDDDSTEVTAPRLVYLAADRPPTTVGAQRAKINADGSEILLSDRVEIRRAAGDRQPALVARTEWLRLWPDSGLARTEAEVEITQGRSRLSGTGMEFNNDARSFVLKSRVTGQFARQR